MSIECRSVRFTKVRQIAFLHTKMSIEIVWVHPSDLKFKLQFSVSESNFLNDYTRVYIFYDYRGVFIEYMTPSLQR